MKKILLIYLLLIILQPLEAVVTLSEYQKIAEQNNLSVQAAFSQYRASVERIKQAGAFEDLQFEVGLYTPPMHQVDSEQVAQFQIMQMFPWPGTRSAAQREMQQMANMDYAQYREICDQLRLDVSSGWWTLLRLTEQLKNNMENKRLLLHLEELTLQRFAASNVSGGSSSSSSGMNMTDSNSPTQSSTMSMSNMGGMGNMPGMNSPTPTQNMPSASSMNMSMPEGMSSMETGGMASVIRIHIEIAEIDNNIASLQSDIQAEKIKFNALLNRSLDAEIDLPNHIEQIDFTFDEESIFENLRLQNPMLSMFTSEEAAYVEKAKMDKRMSYPMFGIGMQYMLNREVHHPLSGNQDMNGKDMIMPMLSMSIPLFRGKYTAQQRENNYMRQASRDNYANMLNMLETELYRLQSQLINTSRKITLYQRQIELANTLHTLTLQEFTSGKGDLNNVIQAQRQLLSYELMSAESQIEYNLIVAQIEKIISGGYL